MSTDNDKEACGKLYPSCCGCVCLGTKDCPKHDLTVKGEVGHDLPFHTEACFQNSRVIRCNGTTDTRKCNICGKQWEEACNFDDDYS